MKDIIILTVFIVIVFWIFLKIGLPKIERAECLKWQEESTEYPDYYFTNWQLEQCENRLERN